VRRIIAPCRARRDDFAPVAMTPAVLSSSDGMKYALSGLDVFQFTIDVY
jgi:hypothetical protein